MLDRPDGDDLHASFPCYLVSGRLGQHLNAAGLSGATAVEVTVELDPQYLHRHPGATAPELLLLKVHGRARADDFGLDEHHRLVVSSAALNAIRQFRLEECRIYDADAAPTPEELTKDIWEEARRVAEATRKARHQRRS